MAFLRANELPFMEPALVLQTINKATHTLSRMHQFHCYVEFVWIGVVVRSTRCLCDGHKLACCPAEPRGLVFSSQLVFSLASMPPNTINYNNVRCSRETIPEPFSCLMYVALSTFCRYGYG